MTRRLAKSLSKLASLTLIVVWIAGPLGAVAQSWLVPAHSHCHCPGHDHHEPKAPGPSFAPCDHGAGANVVGKYAMILEGRETEPGLRIEYIPVFGVTLLDGPPYSPETPPPKTPV